MVMVDKEKEIDLRLDIEDDIITLFGVVAEEIDTVIDNCYHEHDNPHLYKIVKVSEKGQGRTIRVFKVKKNDVEYKMIWSIERDLK